jgi:hypothetical protein
MRLKHARVANALVAVAAISLFFGGYPFLSCALVLSAVVFNLLF